MLIEERVDPLTGDRTLVTKFGELSSLHPERDKRIPAELLPARTDPAIPGYGYTGGLLGVGPVILLTQDIKEQIEGWQRAKGQPWPWAGTESAITKRDGVEVLSIRGTNGTWRWVLHPAYWPMMRSEREFWLRVWAH